MKKIIFVLLLLSAAVFALAACEPDPLDKINDESLVSVIVTDENGNTNVEHVTSDKDGSWEFKTDGETGWGPLIPFS